MDFLQTDRLCRKENKLKLLYSQEAHSRGGGGGRTRLTNAISDVQSLQSIVETIDQISLLPNNHSVTFMSAVTHYTKRNEMIIPKHLEPSPLKNV